MLKNIKQLYIMFALDENIREYFHIEEYENNEYYYMFGNFLRVGIYTICKII